MEQVNNQQTSTATGRKATDEATMDRVISQQIQNYVKVKKVAEGLREQGLIGTRDEVFDAIKNEWKINQSSTHANEAI